VQRHHRKRRPEERGGQTGLADPGSIWSERDDERQKLEFPMVLYGEEVGETRGEEGGWVTDADRSMHGLCF
jgi:hypothetical protein